MVNIVRPAPLLVFALGVAVVSFVRARAPNELSESELRAPLTHGFCAGEEVVEGRTEHWVDFGTTGCPTAPRETAVQRAVLAALDAARAVFVSQENGRLAQARSIEDREERRAAYLAALLEDPFATRALSGALERSLAARGYVCRDCPRTAPPAFREVPWRDFLPYVAAYAWPDPVVTPRGPDGAPSGPATFSLHMCVGINGLSAIDRHDALLARIAFVAAVDGDLGSLMVPRFRHIVHALRRGPARSDQELTELARARMGEAVRRSGVIRRAMCRAVSEREDVFGIHLTGC